MIATTYRTRTPDCLADFTLSVALKDIIFPALQRGKLKQESMRKELPQVGEGGQEEMDGMDTNTNL